MLAAGVSPQDLQFPTVPCETQETSCQAEPMTRSTATQDSTGIAFIDHNLRDCELHSSSMWLMDKYLVDGGYESGHGGSVSDHSFRDGPCVLGAVADRFMSVSPITFRETPDSEVQDHREADCDAFPSWPFRGIHLISYTDDTYPVCLPTRTKRSFITEQLSRTLVELEEPLPDKDHLHTRDAYVRGQRSGAGAPAASCCFL